MKNGLVFAVAALMALGGVARLEAQPPPPLSDFTDDPSGNAGALKDKVETGGGYSAHNGNASRSVTDLEVPGGLGAYGLDLTRHWNSTDESFSAGGGHALRPFGNGGWTHSWNWIAVFDHEIWLCDPEVSVCVGNQTDRRVIQINYPDGRTAKFSFSRTDGRDIHGNYSAHPEGYPWAEHWGGDPAVDDHLRGMDPNGSAFWLFLADGGSVRFERTGFYYRATQVIDPHGLKTTLSYDVFQNGYEIPLLKRVEQPGGRSLNLTWNHFPNQFCPVVSAVQTGTGQRVEYGYNPFSKDGEDLGYALTSVTYVNDPDPVTGQPIQASYFYTAHVSYDPQYTQVIRGLGPLLAEADDPRFMGPMRRIHYIFRGGPCEQQPFPNDPCGAPFYPIATDDPQGGENIDFFHMKPFPVQMELSAETGQMVSQLSIPQNRDGRIHPEVGTRTQSRGAGGSRVFYYGSKCGIEPGGYWVAQNNNPYWEPPEAAPGGYRAFQLGKATEFADDPASAPFDFQRHQVHKPWRIFDGRKLLTQLKWVPWTGRVSEVWHRGADTFNGNLSKRTYNWTDRLASTAQDLNLLPNFYNLWLFSQIDEGGNETVYTRDGLRRVAQIDYPGESLATFGYNSFNQIISHTLPSGAVQTYVYDARGLLRQESNSVDGSAARKEYTYDAFDRVLTMQDGRARQYGKPFSVRLTYNARHQVVMEEYPATNGGAPTKEYRYDRYGNCIAIKNELGAWSTYTYDEYRRCTSYTEPLNAPDWKGTGTVASRTWNWVYDRVLNDNVTVRCASTHTSNKWRLQHAPPHDATGNRRVTARHYDYNDRLSFEYVGIVAPPAGAWDYSQGAMHSYTYDGNGNKESSTDPQGRTTTYEYDQRDRLIKTIETINTIPRTTTTTYDVTGNKTSVTFPDTPPQQWQLYDPFGQAWKFVDERGNITDLSYQWGPMKKLDRVKTYRTRDPGSGGGIEPQTTNFDYDKMGRPQWTVFPDGSRELTTWLYGQVDAFKTRKNQTKRLHYDARGREVYHTWDSDAAPRIDRAWDDANRLSAISNIFSSIDYGYDAAGQVIWEGNDIAGSGGRTQTNYFRYPSGEVAHLYYPGGTYLRRDYTARGQLEATGWDDEENNWWSRLARYHYLPDGKVDKVEYGNGTTSDPAYNGRGFISSVQHKWTASGVVFASHTYTRDTRDRITALQKANGRGDRFRYDAEGQLVEAWYNAANPVASGAGNTRYDGFNYDQLGNRMGSGYVANRGSMTFERKDNGLNQYRAWWPYSYTNYDDDIGGTWGAPGAANGVLMQEGNITAGYNALNQPIQVQGPPQAGTSIWVWFGFDPLGRCVKRWLSDSGDVYSNPATYLHYDGWNLLQEGNNAWGPARVYVHGNRVDEIVWSYNTFTGEQVSHHYDARGHCTFLTDRSGNIVEQYEYDAFGRAYFYDAVGASIGSYDSFGIWQGYSQVGNRFLFTGREWLGDLRIYDFRHRMYQPELGRFLQPDPKHFAAGDYNLYRYCHNDPINSTDPDGLQRNYVPPRQAAPIRREAAPGGRPSGRAPSNISGNRVLPDGRIIPPEFRAPRNPHGSLGKPDHRSVVEKLGDLFRRLFSGRDVEIRTNTSIRSETGVNRRPDVSALEGDRVIMVGEAARLNQNGTMVPRESLKREEYDAAGVPSIFVGIPPK